MLNKGQQEAEKKINQFLLSDQKQMCLIAPSGYGKSYLIDHINNGLSHHNKRCKLLGAQSIHKSIATATTNKAASVLDGGVTLASFLGLQLLTDYKTGKQNLKSTSRSRPIKNHLVWVDESSMVNQEMKGFVDKYLSESKVIWVGDNCQLAPPKEDNSIVFNSGFIEATLDEPMRQSKESPLFKLCEQLRETVKTGIWHPIEAAEGIHRLNGQETTDCLSDWFNNSSHPNSARCITYENKKTLRLNEFIRTLCGYPAKWQVGDLVTSRNVCFDRAEGIKTRIDEVFHIENIEDGVQGKMYGIEFYYVQLAGRLFRVPVSTELFTGALNQAKATKQWATFYSLKENFIDLRSSYACTTHVAQGSTYDSVYVDLSDLGRCWDASTLARLLYVAVSRAKKEVVFNGRLPTRFGG